MLKNNKKPKLIRQAISWYGFDENLELFHRNADSGVKVAAELTCIVGFNTPIFLEVIRNFGLIFAFAEQPSKRQIRSSECVSVSFFSEIVEIFSQNTIILQIV